MPLNIKNYPLKPGEWIAEKVKKTHILWHGTQGRTAMTPHNGKPGVATTSIDWWNSSPGRVGAAFLIDRDGTIYQTFDEGEWIFHLGLKNTNGFYDKHSIAIELANELNLIKEKDKYYAFEEIDKDNLYIGEVNVRASEWRDNKYFAKLPVSQVSACIELTKSLCTKHHIEMKFFSPSEKFDYPRCFEVSGILCHSNCRMDKHDLPLEPWVYDELLRSGFELVE